MGRGTSKVSGGSGGLFQNPAFVDNFKPSEWREKEDAWDEYADSFGAPLSAAEEADIAGYVGTPDAWQINKKFYDPTAGGLDSKEKATVDALDQVIDTHHTPADAFYTRYTGGDAISGLLGIPDSQVRLLEANASDPNFLAEFNKAVAGSTMFSPSFTSTSATTESVFKKYLFRREISAPKGTKAFATNFDETEVIFGRNLNTVLDHISFDSKARGGRGQIVVHERFVKYGQ